MNAHLTADDIAAIRTEEGGLTALIAALTQRPPANTPAPPPPTGSLHGPLHRPGAWPAGIHAPTGSATCHPDCDCTTQPRPAA